MLDLFSSTFRTFKWRVFEEMNNNNIQREPPPPRIHKDEDDALQIFDEKPEQPERPDDPPAKTMQEIRAERKLRQKKDKAARVAAREKRLGLKEGAPPPQKPVAPPVLRAPRVDAAKFPPAPVQHPKLDIPSVLAWPVGAPHVLGFCLNEEHLKLRPKEVYQMPDCDLENVKSEELLELVKTADFTSAFVFASDYSGNCPYKSGAQLEPSIKALIAYCESNAKAAPDMKPKLRFITKALRKNPDGLGVLVMLAAHSGVCNVQKEIGVRLGYDSLIGAMQSDCDANDPKNATIRLLYGLREMCVENLYVAQGM